MTMAHKPVTYKSAVNDANDMFYAEFTAETNRYGELGEPELAELTIAGVSIDAELFRTTFTAAYNALLFYADDNGFDR